MPDHHPAPPQAPSVGELVELSRYSTARGQRIVRGQRILGVVRVTDAPADGNGRTYLVERGLQSHQELLGLVSHYVEHGRQLGDIPLLHLYPNNGEVAS
jgi:hypothetical protein